jgi:hypothetical protein
MKKFVLILFLVVFNQIYSPVNSFGQCSICTKTAQQLGEKPAKGMNTGILYLAATPFLIAGFVFYRWKKSNQAN